jgi:hypothetical protein
MVSSTQSTIIMLDRKRAVTSNGYRGVLLFKQVRVGKMCVTYAQTVDDNIQASCRMSSNSRPILSVHLFNSHIVATGWSLDLPPNFGEGLPCYISFCLLSLAYRELPLSAMQPAPCALNLREAGPTGEGGVLPETYPDFLSLNLMLPLPLTSHNIICFTFFDE